MLQPVSLAGFDANCVPAGASKLQQLRLESQAVTSLEAAARACPTDPSVLYRLALAKVCTEGLQPLMPIGKLLQRPVSTPVYQMQACFVRSPHLCLLQIWLSLQRRCTSCPAGQSLHKASRHQQDCSSLPTLGFQAGSQQLPQAHETCRLGLKLSQEGQHGRQGTDAAVTGNPPCYR